MIAITRKPVRNVDSHGRRSRSVPDAVTGLITLVVFLALVGSLVLLGSMWQPSSTSPVPAKPPLVFRGTQMSLDAAQQLVSFHIAVPTFSPQPLSYRSVRVDSSWPTGPLVYLIYASGPISANTTSDDLLASGGFFIVEVPEPGTDPGPIIGAQVQQNGATRISVNGIAGFYAGNQVHWWAGGIHYNIVSPYSESDMCTVATSMGT